MAMRAINKLFRSLSDVGREFILREYNKRRVQPPDSIQEICAALYSNKGQALGTALAGEVVLAYGELHR